MRHIICLTIFTCCLSGASCNFEKEDEKLKSTADMPEDVLRDPDRDKPEAPAHVSTPDAVLDSAHDTSQDAVQHLAQDTIQNQVQDEVRDFGDDHDPDQEIEQGAVRDFDRESDDSSSSPERCSEHGEMIHASSEPEIPQEYLDEWRRRSAHTQKMLNLRKKLLEAIDEFEKGNTEEAVNILKELSRLDTKHSVPSEAMYRLEIINKYLNSIGKAESALESEAFEEAIKACFEAETYARMAGPRGTAQSRIRKKRAEIFYLQGRSYYKKDKYPEALRFWLTARILNPSNSSANKAIEELETYAGKLFSSISEGFGNGEAKASMLERIISISPHASEVHQKARQFLIDMNRTPPIPTQSAPYQEVPDDILPILNIGRLDADELKEAIVHRDMNTRLSAITSIARRDDLPHKKRVELLLTGLEQEIRLPTYPTGQGDTMIEPEYFVRDLIISTLIRLGEDAKPFIEKALEGRSGEAEEDILIVLGRLKSQKAIPGLRRILEESSSPYMRMKAADNLGLLEDRESIPVLIEALEDPYVATGQSCCQSWVLFPVREHAAGALRRMNIEVNRNDDYSYRVED